MSDPTSTLTFNDREQLVAYLDGELSAVEAADVEDRLSTDAQFRREMQRLARAWDMLDELPQPTAGEAFAKTTIDMVTVAAEEEVADAKSRIGHRRVGRSLWIAGALAAALIAGFVTARRIWPDPNRQLVADLPVIDQLDTLTQFRDVQFLRELSGKIGLQMDVLGPADLKSDLADLKGLAAASRRERRQHVVGLESDDAAALLAHLDRFRELDEDGQQRVRQLFRDIMAAPDADNLLATMLRYAAWLDDRSAGERATLRELSVDERIERIGQVLEKGRRTAMRRLSAEEQRALREVVVSYVREHWQELVRAVPDTGRDRSRFERLQRGDVPDRMKIFVGARLLEFRQNANHLDALYQKARDALSDESRQYLDNLQSRQGSQMRRWVADAFKPPEITEQQLEQFFTSDALTNDEREALLAMPWDQMRQKLLGRYFQEEYGLRWDRFEGGPRSPNTFRRPGGRRGNGPPRGPRGGPGWRREFDPDRPPPADRPGPPPPAQPPGPPREEPRE